MQPPISNIIKTWSSHIKLNTKYFQSMPSTNEYAKQKMFEQTTLIYTDYQTSGKGRGKIWVSPKMGTSFQGSYVFLSKNTPYPILSPLVGLTLHKALCSTWPTYKNYFSIKPPNDLYFDKSKIAGILIENINSNKINQTIIGIGINMYSNPPKITHSSSLNTKIGKITRKEVIQFFTLKFEGLKNAMADAKLPNLKSDARTELLKAINNHPNYHYQEVMKDGSLKEKNGTIKNFIEI